MYPSSAPDGGFISAVRLPDRDHNGGAQLVILQQSHPGFIERDRKYAAPAVRIFTGAEIPFAIPFWIGSPGIIGAAFVIPRQLIVVFILAVDKEKFNMIAAWETGIAFGKSPAEKVGGSFFYPGAYVEFSAVMEYFDGNI